MAFNYQQEETLVSLVDVEDDGLLNRLYEF
jgi:hypothetical protein